MHGGWKEEEEEEEEKTEGFVSTVPVAGESSNRERDVNYPCSSHIPFYVSRAINSEGESAKGEEAGEEQFLHGLPRGSSLALRG